ncbi:hypothetical protein Y71_17215 [Kosakonia radicincitans DSM 16656]|uniref:ead/Ea22-like family protein n=1 Tax=Kosakonia radicincitans TaxID=283686 RepID=UPI000272DF2D|nr:hypothetical protein Y71_17215 [Kosakonia radicincitans DSM 16656]
MTNNDELAIKLKAAAEVAMDAWKKFLSLPDDVDLERGLSLDEFTLISYHNGASNPANILALLAERDAKDARIAELEELADLQRDKIKRLESDLWDEQHENVHYADAAELEIAALHDRITELEALATDYGMKFQRAQDDLKKMALMHRDGEARTVSVKLPKPHAHLIWIQAGRGPDDYWDDVEVSRSEKDRCCDGSERYPVYSIFEIQKACAAAGVKLVLSDVSFVADSRSVKLPKTMYTEFDDDDYCREVAVLDKQQVIDALVAAGIKLDVGE